jgi:hypothetical protein
MHLITPPKWTDSEARCPRSPRSHAFLDVSTKPMADLVIASIPLCHGQASGPLALVVKNVVRAP